MNQQLVKSNLRRTTFQSNRLLDLIEEFPVRNKSSLYDEIVARKIFGAENRVDWEKWVNVRARNEIRLTCCTQKKLIKNKKMGLRQSKAIYSVSKG